MNTKGIFEWEFPSSSHISFFRLLFIRGWTIESLMLLVTLDEGEQPFYELIRAEEVRI